MPATVASKTSVVLNDVSWDFYLRTLEEVSTGTRVTFDKGKMEIMSPVSYKHDRYKKLIARMLESWCERHDQPLSPAGSLTLKRDEIQRGLEPDEAYFIHAKAPDADTEMLDLSIFQGPDLVIEVDITTHSINKEPLYLELGAEEIWVWDDQSLRIRVNQAGRFVDSTTSRLLPAFPVALFIEHLRQSKSLDPSQAINAWRLATPR